MKLGFKKIVSAYKEKAKRFNELSPEDKTHYDAALLSWSSHLNQEYERGGKWYLLGGIGILLLAAYGILTNQWTFSVALIVFAGVYYFVSHQETPTIDVKVSDIGIKVGKRVYPYTELKTFWIEYNPPYFQNLHLIPDNQYKPEITVQIHQVNISDLRRILSRYLPEWKERKKTVSETIIQSLGL